MVMDTALDHLDPRFKVKVFELLARFTEARLSIVVSNTRRTTAEQAVCRQRGLSWVSHSKHEDGLAIDVCPWGIYRLHGENKLQWDADDPVWEQIGKIGESLGLVWGGRWSQRDMGHFEQGS